MGHKVSAVTAPSAVRYESSQRHYVNEWVRLCDNKVLFAKIVADGIWHHLWNCALRHIPKLVLRKEITMRKRAMFSAFYPPLEVTWEGAVEPSVVVCMCL